jgi:solute carrier family 30 (zinc transporter), member 9
MSEHNPGKISGLASAIYAVIGNLIIAVLKLIGFLISGSAALFSEAVHSFVDTLNQSLIIIGLRKSVKEADKEHEYGHGRERFVWSLISACGIFSIGAGVTLYHGIHSLMKPESVEISTTTILILLVSFIVESLTLFLAVRELLGGKRSGNFFQSLREGDPAIVAVIYEDSVGVIGVVVAFASIILAHVTKAFWWDSVGSIIIGLMLGVMAIVLINKNRKYLITHSIPEKIRERVTRIMEEYPLIEKVLDFKSATLDIDKYRVKCEVEFNGAALIKEIEQSGFIRNNFDNAKKDYSEFLKYSVDLIDQVPRLIGKKIDKTERKIEKEFSEIKHVDIEIN